MPVPFSELVSSHIYRQVKEEDGGYAIAIHPGKSRILPLGKNNQPDDKYPEQDQHFMYSVDYVFDEILEPHQQIRIKVSLGLEDDPSGAGYNVNQSKIAIGSGGLTGKGFLNGTQTKLKYVPEQETDFIFCTVGEEHGFIGSSVVLILFGIFIIRLVILETLIRIC